MYTLWNASSIWKEINFAKAGFEYWHSNYDLSHIVNGVGFHIQLHHLFQVEHAKPEATLHN